MDANSAGLTYMEEGLIDALPIQDAASYGALAVEYLYKKIMGEEMPEVGDTVTVEGELWSPAMIVEDEEGVCPIMLLNSPIVPWDVPTTDPRIWGNIARGITE
jgi:ribose transport system substrate-binding protein